MIEIILRIVSYGNNLNLFIEHPEKSLSDYYTTNPNIGEKYFLKFEATGGVNDVFLKEKPDSTYRIFVMGSSTVVGFPYDKNLMFSRILHQRLHDAYPNRHIEVVNTAITAINTITLLDFAHEIVRYQPDAIVFYAGHNEFYGAFGIGSNETLSKNQWLQNLHFKMMHLRIYQLMRNASNRIMGDDSKSGKISKSKGSLMKRIVAKKDIEYQSATYNIGINQFRSNLTEILKLAKANQVDVFISDVVSDVKDIPPFGSAATVLYPSADSVYNLAWNYYNAAEYSKADSLFYLAKDLDLVRFRASEQINFIIDSLANAYNCHFVSTKEAFRSASPNGIIGHNLLTEHVHPNISGQFLLADVFFNGILKANVIDPNAEFTNLKGALYYRQNWAYTELDSLIGLYRVNQLKSYWPFVKVEGGLTFRDSHKVSGLIDSLAFQAIMSSSPNIAKLHDILASHYVSQGDYKKALREYKAMVKISPYWSIFHNKAAVCYLKLDDLYNAEKSLKSALKYNPNYLSFITLAEIEMLKHNFTYASALYKKAFDSTSEKEEKVTVLKKMCLNYSLLGNTTERIKCEQQLKKLGVKFKAELSSMPFTYSDHIPHDIKPWVQTAYTKIEIQDFDSAIYFVNKAIEINDCPVANYLMGEILKQKKDKQLLYFYLKAYPTYQYNAEFLHNLCIAYVVNNNNEQAKLALSQIKKIDADYTGIPALENLLAGN